MNGYDLIQQNAYIFVTFLSCLRFPLSESVTARVPQSREDVDQTSLH